MPSRAKVNKPKQIVKYMTEEEIKDLTVGATTSDGIVASIEQTEDMSKEDRRYKSGFENSVSGKVLGDNVAGHIAYQAEDAAVAVAKAPVRLTATALDLAGTAMKWFDDDEEEASDSIFQTARKWSVDNAPVTLSGQIASEVADAVIGGKLLGTATKGTKIAKHIAEGSGLVNKAEKVALYKGARNLVSVNPNVGNASDALKGTFVEDLPIMGGIVKSLQTDEDDSLCIRRIKNAADQMLIETAFDGAGVIGRKMFSKKVASATEKSATKWPDRTPHLQEYQDAGLDLQTAKQVDSVKQAYAHSLGGDYNSHLARLDSIKFRYDEQLPEGVKGLYNGSEVVLGAGADINTPFHEFAHVLIHDISEKINLSEAPDCIRNLKTHMDDFVGVKAGTAYTRQQTETLADTIAKISQGADVANVPDAMKTDIHAMMSDLANSMVLEGANPVKALGMKTLKTIGERENDTLLASGISSNKAIQEWVNTKNLTNYKYLNYDAVSDSAVKDLHSKLSQAIEDNKELIRNKQGYKEAWKDAERELKNDLGGDVLLTPKMESAIMASHVIREQTAERGSLIRSLMTEVENDEQLAILAGHYQRVNKLYDAATDMRNARLYSLDDFETYFDLADDIKTAIESGGPETADKIYKMLGGKEFVMGRLHTIVSAGGGAETDSAIQKLGIFSRTWDTICDVYISAMLSKPVTHVKNVLNNVFVPIIKSPEYMIGGCIYEGVSKATTALGLKKWALDHQLNFLVADAGISKQSYKAGYSMLANLGKGIQTCIDLGANAMTSYNTIKYNGLRMAGDAGNVSEMAARHFINSDILQGLDPNSFTAKYYQTLINIVDSKVVKTPRVLLQAGDNASKVMSAFNNADLYLRDKAIRELKLTGEAIDDYVADNINKIVNTIKNDAGKTIQLAVDANLEKYMLEDVFQESPDALAKTLIELRTKFPALTPLMPFIKTPANCIRFNMTMTPGIGLIYKSQREAFMRGGLDASREYGKWAIGGMLMAAGAMGWQQGWITGDAPRNESVRRSLEATGWQPNSIHIGDKYYSYKALETLNFFFSTASTVAEMFSNAPNDETWYQEAANVMGAVMSVTAQTASNRSEMESVFKCFQAIQRAGNGDPEALSDWFGRMGSSMLLSGLQPLAVVNDLTTLGQAKKEVRTLLDKLKARVPGMSETLPNRYNHITGEVIYSQSFGSINPYPVTNYNSSIPDDIMSVIMQYPSVCSAPSKRINEVSLTAQQYSDLCRQQGIIQLNGKTYLEALTGKIRSSAYRKADDETKQDMLQTISDKYRKAARAKIIKDYPELDKEAQKEHELDNIDVPRLPQRQILEDVGYPNYNEYNSYDIPTDMQDIMIFGD